MIVFPHAKINLGLWIQERLPNSFHRIESVFYPIPLCDVLECVHSSEAGIDLSCSGILIPAGPNIVQRAANHFFNGSDATPGLKIHLHKRIPLGAGLGGGSSDGAFTLKALKALYPNQNSERQLQEIASDLGSDCSFFMNKGAAYLNGVGPEIEPYNFSLEDYYLVLINPGIHVSTKEAYQNCEPKLREESFKAIIEDGPQRWKDHLGNDFEKTVFKSFPLIREVKEELYNQGALYASMSGSGSSLFGLFKEQPNCKDVFKDYFYWEGKLN